MGLTQHVFGPKVITLNEIGNVIHRFRRFDVCVVLPNVLACNCNVIRRRFEDSPPVSFLQMPRYLALRGTLASGVVSSFVQIVRSGELPFKVAQV